MIHDDKERDARRVRFAESLAAFLHLPSVPADLYAKVTEALNDLFNQAGVSLTTPEVMRVALPLALANLNDPASASASPDARAAPPESREREKPYLPLSLGEALALADRAVIPDDDDGIHALMHLVNGIAYDPDSMHRMDIATAVTNYLYTRSMHFDRASEEFLQTDKSDTGGEGKRP